MPSVVSLMAWCRAFRTGFELSVASGREIPLCEAVPAEPREIHEVNILHVGPALQVCYQATKSGGFNFNTSFFIHKISDRYVAVIA